MQLRATIAVVALAAAGVVGASSAGHADVRSEAASVVSGNVAGLDGWVYFAAAAPETGVELWRTAGETVELAADIVPGPVGSYPSEFVTFDGWVYFTVETASDGHQLWRTNGSSTGFVADDDPDPDGSLLLEKTVYDGRLFVNSLSSLLVLDGSTLGVLPATEAVAYRHAVPHDGWLYLAGIDGLRRTDGQVVETVSDIEVRGDRELFSGSTPPAGMGEWLYFAGFTEETGVELWRTDGVAVELVADVWAGPASSEPYGLDAFDGWLYFGAETPDVGGELWRSDGTTTELVADLHPGPRSLGTISSYPGPFSALGEWLYFRAETPDVGAELWRTDGETTELFADLSPGRASGEPRGMRTVDGHLYFRAPFGLLWWTDGATVVYNGVAGTPLFAQHHPEWFATSFTPSVAGAHTFVVEYAEPGTKIDVREAATGRWIGANTTDEMPKSLSVDLVAGVEYRVATWPGGARIVSVIEPESPPPGEVLFDGVVDAERVIAPAWTSSTFVPSVSREYTLSLGWDGPADVRLEVRNADTGSWIAAATDGRAPRTVTIALDAGVRYRIAVWSTSGAADFEVGVDVDAATPDEVFSGAVDADRLIAPKWVSTTFVPGSSGDHAFSLAWLGDAALQVEIRERVSGVWVGSDTSAAHPKVLTVDLDAGVEYRVAVWSTSGDAEFVVTTIPPGG